MNNFKYLRNNLTSLGIIIFIFFVDRFTKLWVISYVEKTENNFSLFLTSFLNIELIWNEGIAFGILSFEQDRYYFLITIIILLVILLLFWWLVNSAGVEKFALSLILGGAIGNVVDRIYFMAVPDFIDFHINNFHWFVFNIADIFITIGITIMLINEFKKKND